MIKPESCCILNGGAGAWAFAGLANQLSQVLEIEISETPRRYNYLLMIDSVDPSQIEGLFIPHSAMLLAADKRLLATAFAQGNVPMPETRLLDSVNDAEEIVRANPEKEWCLKFPTGCGGSGHRRFTSGMTLPKSWPMPLVMQEFIRLENPEVYRVYVAGGELFGWVVRRFPKGITPSPWVAHARGARYEDCGEAPEPAKKAARKAFQATGLINAFGCADMIQNPNGTWLVLEVGTDGLFNHVDRNLDLPHIEKEIQERIANAFWTCGST